MPWTPWLDGIERPFAARRIVFADRGARFHGVDHHALIGGFKPRDVFRLGEGFGNLGRIAIVIVERDIVRHGIEDQRRAGLHCISGCEHDRQRIDVDRHSLGGVLCLRNGFRDDTDNRIADITNFVAGKGGARRVTDRRSVAALERHVAFERPVGGQIGRGINTEHARHRLRRVGADRADDAVGFTAADDDGVDLAGPVEIIRVAAFAAHQFGIFAAPHRLADAEFGQATGRFRWFGRPY